MLYETFVTDGAGVVGAFASVEVRATSSRSKIPSLLLAVAWWSSTAMVLSPLANRLAGTWYSLQALSAVPETNELAGVLAVSAPAGRFERTASTPLM